VAPVMRFRRIKPRTIVTGLVAVSAVGLAGCGRSHRGDDDAASVGGSAGRGGVAGIGAGGVAGRAASAGGAGSGNAGSASAAHAGSAGRSGGGASGGGSAGAAGVELGGRAGASGAAGAGAPSLGGSAGQGGTLGEAGQGGDAGSETLCMLDAPPQACESQSVGFSPFIDFATYAANGRWGVTAPYGLSGGTTLYHAPGGEDFTVEALNGELHASGRVPSHGSTGIVLWFDPCVELSSVGALYFPVGGDLGNADFKLVIQTNADAPIDVANQRGACALTSCETGLSACRFPSSSIPVLPTIETTLQNIRTFGGGVPVSTPAGLLDLVGFEFQVTCLSDSDCPVSFTLGTLAFQSL